MFGLAIIFLIVAVVAAFLGFCALSGTAAWTAKIVFIIGIILFVVSLMFDRKR